MVVDINSVEDVRNYVRSQASLGLQHVTELVRGSKERMMALIGDLHNDEANLRTSADEYSISEVLQHLSNGLERSAQRLWTLSVGQPWVNTGPGRGPGALPDVFETDFSKVRTAFEEGSNSVLRVLEQADPASPSDITTSHPVYGTMNWLEWAVYSHHVHTEDHVGQVAKIREALRAGK